MPGFDLKLGEAVDRAAVLAQQLVGVAGGRIQLAQRGFQLLQDRRQLLHQVLVQALETRRLLAAADLLLDINQDTLPSDPAYFGAGAGGVRPLTDIPLAYGAFCAAYDWGMAGYFVTRRAAWRR